MWREITEADVLGTLSAAENSAFRYASTESGSDVLGSVVRSAVQQARGYIADNPQNTLAPGDTLPERCIRPALHWIRRDLITRLDLEVTKDRVDAAREATHFFERVADGKITIEAPEGSAEIGPHPSVESIRSRPRINRDNLSGL
jgi:hypothetical protein